MKTFIILLLLIPGVLALNSCLDPDSSDYRCDDVKLVKLNDCGLIDGDWEDMSSCLTNGTLISLRNNSLTSIPDGFFDGLFDLFTVIRSLDLGSNSITDLPNGIFDSKGLVYLLLDDNSLTDLPDGIFDNSPDLRYITLNDNSLTYLPDGIFDNTPNLISLFLQKNSLTALPDGVFDHLTRITTLHLNDNNFVTIDSGTFSGLTLLEELSVSPCTPDDVLDHLDSSYSCTTESTPEDTIEEESTPEDTIEEESTPEDTIEEESTPSPTSIAEEATPSPTIIGISSNTSEESTPEDTIVEETTPSPTSIAEETTPSPLVSRTETSSSTSTVIGISSSIAVVVLIGAIVFMRRRKSESTKQGDIEDGSLPEETTANLTTSDSTLVIDGHEKRSTDIGMGRAVFESAKELANSSQIPGVSELATVVSILVNLLVDNKGNKNSTDASIRRCRSLITLLKRATEFLGRGSETTVKAELVLIQDVYDSIHDLVDLVKTYRNKNKVSQLLTSTIFRKRQDEFGSIVENAISSLQFGLHVQVGHDVRSIRDLDHNKAVVESRKVRRQRKLDQLEIPMENLSITDELLGKGGFGEVFIADYNGRNAAAKVIRVIQETGNSQSKAFLTELGNMTRLSSPYTVHVYGAVTSQPDKFILVMELLSGGDLRTLLKSEEKISYDKSFQIIGDICAGMDFLHSKNIIHGDLKSANVILDGSGRAKIADFGTSVFIQNTMSTGLATFTSSDKKTQMSLAWSAPEILDAVGSTFKSDVYSFGIVIWEIFSREIPWSTLQPKDVYIRVVLKGLRPEIPKNVPGHFLKMMESCWKGEECDRPSFRSVMEDIKSHGWNEKL